MCYNLKNGCPMCGISVSGQQFGTESEKNWKGDGNMLSDIEIATSAKMLPISEIAKKVGIEEEELEYYGKYHKNFKQFC